jgi:hypothetical protein
VRIVTIGSCLSRYIADMWLTMMEGELVNSVYNNRIDALVANYFSSNGDRGRQLPDYHQMIKYLDYLPGKEQAVKEVLLNQYPKRIGMHHMPKGTPTLTKTLHTTSVDLIIMDNYMDSGVRLLSPKGEPDQQVFCNYQFVPNWQEHFALGELLPMDEAAAHWQTLLLALRELQPTARLVFCHFPVNVYGQKDRERRSLEFEANFTLPAGLEHAHIIPSIAVAPKHQSEEPRHFLPTQYAFYTGILYQLMQTDDGLPMPRPLAEAQKVRHRLMHRLLNIAK